MMLHLMPVCKLCDGTPPATSQAASGMSRVLDDHGAEAGPGGGGCSSHLAHVYNRLLHMGY